MEKKRMAVLWLRFLKEVAYSETVDSELTEDKAVGMAVNMCERGAFTSEELEVYDAYLDRVRRELGYIEMAEEGKKNIEEGKKNIEEGKKMVEEGKKAIEESKKAIEEKEKAFAQEHEEKEKALAEAEKERAEKEKALAEIAELKRLIANR
jgi:glutamate synthase domain-containing protein 1